MNVCIYMFVCIYVVCHVFHTLSQLSKRLSTNHHHCPASSNFINKSFLLLHSLASSHFIISFPSLPLFFFSPSTTPLWSGCSAATLQDDQKQVPPVPKKPGKGRPVLGREKSADSVSTSSSASAEKQRQDARKRLLAAKRAASVRQNSATESADSIEIYVPEAQTRL